MFPSRNGNVKIKKGLFCLNLKSQEEEKDVLFVLNFRKGQNDVLFLMNRFRKFGLRFILLKKIL